MFYIITINFKVKVALLYVSAVFQLVLYTEKSLRYESVTIILLTNWHVFNFGHLIAFISVFIIVFLCMILGTKRNIKGGFISKIIF